jgi:hypothetical protein
MHATDIVGYTFRADVYCPEHVCGATLDGYADEPDKQDAMNAGTNVRMGTEYNLAAMAGALDVGREDESSFDSDDFPKVIFADMVHDTCTAENGYDHGQCGDQCASCYEPLGFECPNAADARESSE